MDHKGNISPKDETFLEQLKQMELVFKCNTEDNIHTTHPASSKSTEAQTTQTGFY